LVRSTFDQFPDIGAAAVLGNIAVESAGTFDYQIHQKKGPAYGLFQMEPPMFRNYTNWMKLEGRTDSAESQILYAHDQVMHGSRIGIGNAIKIRAAFNSGSVQQATEVFCLLFEKPNPMRHPQVDKRIDSANTFLDRFHHCSNSLEPLP
jgi:hypothetical protein